MDYREFFIIAYGKDITLLTIITLFLLRNLIVYFNNKTLKKHEGFSENSFINKLEIVPYMIFAVLESAIKSCVNFAIFYSALFYLFIAYSIIANLIIVGINILEFLIRVIFDIIRSSLTLSLKTFD